MHLRADRSAAKPWQVWGALLVVYFVWGSTYLAIRFALETVPPFLMAGTRFLTAGFSMMAWSRVRGGVLPTPIQWRDAAIVGGSLLLLGNGGVTFAEQFIPSGSAALLVATVPLFLTLFAWWSGQTGAPGPLLSGGLLGGLAGVALLAFDASPMPGASRRDATWGVVAVLVASVSWAAGSLYSKRAFRPASPTMAIGAQMTAGGVLLCFVGFSAGEGAHLRTPSAVSLFAWIYLVTLGALLAFSLYLWLMRTADPALVGTYAFVNPAVALLLGSLLAGETLGARAWAGAGLIVASVCLIVTHPASASRRPDDQ